MVLHKGKSESHVIPEEWYLRQGRLEVVLEHDAARTRRNAA